MEKQRPDIIELLEQEKAYYADQIKRVNIALSALKGEMTSGNKENKPTRKSIPWVNEITVIFKDNDTLTTSQIKNKLAERGIAEALETSSHNTIYSTLSRMVNKKRVLFKNEDGSYSKRKQRMPIPFDEQDKEKEEMPDPFDDI